ncbi:efflux RND transporter periplasmic adaptor subunit [Caldimonas sp. KR1-144]|uniref:efflux RND transporter periplasmic adaptor subunit n=1 Tax=Caldimonas sp. KR1-144 TaxID=3400911 RepID=UPI003C015840
MQRRTKIIAVAVVAAVLAGAGAAWLWGPVRVETARPSRGPAIEAVYATGVVEPTVMVPIAPRSGGRLVALEADEGASVRRGQVLARIEAADLDQTVQEMQAREQLARAQHERTRELVSQKFVSPAELDRTRSELQAAEAALRRAQAQRNYNQLVAPADGLVLRRDGELGQYIPAGQPVLTLACCAPLRVTADVDEEDIPRVTVGQAVVMHTDALPGRVFDGNVAEITPKGDTVSRSYRVRIRFREPVEVGAGPLRTGMTMDTNLIVARRDNALLVPNSALKGNVLWLVDADDRLQRREVRKGATGTERTEVLAGLRDDESVVLSPAEGLREGRRAHVKPPIAEASAASPAASR